MDHRQLANTTKNKSVSTYNFKVNPQLLKAVQSFQEPDLKRFKWDKDIPRHNQLITMDQSYRALTLDVTWPRTHQHPGFFHLSFQLVILCLCKYSNISL